MCGAAASEPLAMHSGDAPTATVRACRCWCCCRPAGVPANSGCLKCRLHGWEGSKGAVRLSNPKVLVVNGGKLEICHDLTGSKPAAVQRTLRVGGGRHGTKLHVYESV